MFMEKIWRDIPGFTDYEISNTGDIRSKKRMKKYKSGRVMQLKSIEKKQRPHPTNNFMMTDLVDDKGKRKTVYPHKAVAMAFLKNDQPRKKKVVIHVDGDLSNNHVDNLRWASYKESIRIGFETGKRDNSNLWEKRREKYGPMGGTKPMGRPDPLTVEQKKEIVRLRLKENMKFKDLAEKYKCSISHVYKVIQKYTKQEKV